MKPEAIIYRAEIIRAVMGSGAHPSKVADMHRLNQIAEHLANCEEAQTIIRAKGHGTAGMSFIELARSVPDNVREKLKQMFLPKRAAPYPSLGEAGDTWSAH